MNKLVPAEAACTPEFGGGKCIGLSVVLRLRACHIVTGSPRNDLVADAPPFLAIGRKYGFDTEPLISNLVGPHRKMNFSLSHPEANDIAAYIQTLAR